MKARKRGGRSGAAEGCPTCGGPMSEETRLQMAPFPEDGTEGQQADHMMASESGQWDDWAEEVTERFCAKCEPPALKLARTLGVRFGPR